MTKREVDGMSLYRLTVGQFRQLDELGFFGGYSNRIELLEGYMVMRESRTPAHNAALGRLFRTFTNDPPGFTVRSQAPVTLLDSEPMPDLAIVAGNMDDYALKHPAPAEIAFVVETADTTVERDRITKGRIYANAGILVYWIVNLPERQVEVYTRPRSGNGAVYRHRKDFAANESVSVTIGTTTIGPILVADLLPPA